MTEITSYMGWKIDYANPPGEPAYNFPSSVHWRIFKNALAGGIGGVAAVLLQYADPRIRSGLLDHSTFKADPVGRVQRTAIAGMVGVYGPQQAARRVIQGVTNMHAQVTGVTPEGKPYRALDPEVLDWVWATTEHCILKAYDRFVAPVSEADKRRFYGEGGSVGALYGVKRTLLSDADFILMMEALAKRFEPHPVVEEFLEIVGASETPPGTPKFLPRAVVRAAVSLLPPSAREKLELGDVYDLTLADKVTLKALGVQADRQFDPMSPPCQASLRMGLPVDFLYRSPKTQKRLLAEAGESV